MARKKKARAAKKNGGASDGGAAPAAGAAVPLCLAFDSSQVHTHAPARTTWRSLGTVSSGGGAMIGPVSRKTGCITIDLLHGGLHGAGAQVGEAEVQAAFLAFCECLDRKRLCGAERQLHQPATIPRR